MKLERKYFWRSFLLAFLALPLLLQLISILGFVGIVSNALPVAPIALLLALAAALWMGRSLARSPHLPETVFFRALPLLATLGYYLLLFCFAFGLSGYSLEGSAFGALTWASAPWIITQFLAGLAAQPFLYPLILLGVYGLLLLSLLFFSRKEAGAALDKRGLAQVAGIFLAFCCLLGFQAWDRAQNSLILDFDHETLTVGSELDYGLYQPFNDTGYLYVPENPPSLEITSDYPRLDGATAAFPVYGAMTQAIYKGLDMVTAEEYVRCSTTTEGYARLIGGQADIFFGAQPSKDQLAQAQAAGVELTLIPIAQEAFVFFVSQENPVEGLTSDQIRDIYGRKITNWKKVGGAEEKILPFQRPENSGSQTIMKQFMGSAHLARPLKEEGVSFMDGVISRVADYRNYGGAIGYSFRYFATEMVPNDAIRLLAIDGVAPTVENIKNGSYPLTIEVYAVVTKEPEGNVKLLLDWIQSPQGQDFIEGCGYVGIGAG